MGAEVPVKVSLVDANVGDGKTEEVVLFEAGMIEEGRVNGEAATAVRVRSLELVEDSRLGVVMETIIVVGPVVVSVLIVEVELEVNTSALLGPGLGVELELESVAMVSELLLMPVDDAGSPASLTP